MKQVIVGGVEQSAISIISKYLETVYSNIDFKILAEQGIAGIVSRGITNPDVVLIVLASDIHTGLKTKVKTIGHAKVYKYTSDEALEEYCGKMVGVEVKSEPFSKPVPPDEDLDLPPLQGVVEDTPIEIKDFSANSDLEAEVSKLNDTVAQKDMIIRNLEQQLAEINSGASDDEKELIAEIKRLNEEIDTLKSKANSSSELDYSAKAKIEFAEKKITELNELKSKVDNYEIQVTSFRTQIEDLTEENTSLSSQVNDYVDEVNDLNSTVSDLNKQIEVKTVEINAKTSDINLLQEKISSLSAVESTVEGLNTELSELRLSLQNKELDITSLNTELESLRGSLSEEQNKCGTLVEERDNLETQITELQNIISEKDTNIQLISSDLSKVQTENNDLLTQIEKLNSDILAKSEENDLIREKITELRGKANSNAEMSEELKKALDEQAEELHKKEEEFKVKSEEFEKQRAEFEKLAKESSSTQVVVDKLISEKQGLEDRIVGLTEANLTLESNVTNLTSQLEGKDATIQSYVSKVQVLETEQTKSANTIESLQTQVTTNKATNERVAALESELLEERRKVSNLTSELEVMKKIDDSGRVADLKVEVAQLKHKLNEVSNNDADLRRYKQRCTELELQLAENETKSKGSGVFSQMSNIAFPKLACDCKLNEVTGLASNFICVASGSSESTSPAYQLLRRTCQKYRDKRCLIIDLSTDSYIDREFGTEKVVSPVDWLQGNQPFTNFVSNTKFPNVKVVSTGLAYLNDLCFLQTDWQNRLSELQGFADVVFIYIGCLNNMVTKILFNTFNSCMRSFVITKATPINLRTVILTLTGLININKSLTTIGCVNFDANTSKGLYQRLADKYNAQIYSDTDVITL